MITSTPEVRRLGRRSIVLPSPRVPQPMVVLEELPNDELERSARRSLADVHRRVSNIRAQTPLIDLSDSTKFMGDQEIKDHLQICSNLYANGKITSKNAWQLHIIDILKHVAKKEGPNSLQVAGNSLDIGAKVYGIRVDDIYASGLKLAASIAKTSEKAVHKENDNSEEGGDNDTLQNNEKVVQKRKKKKMVLRKGKKITIAKDENSITGPLPKLESAYFASRIIRSDATAVENLTSNQVRMDKTGYKLLTEEAAWTSSNEHEVRNDTKYMPPFKPLGKNKICHTFEDFHIDEWDPNEDEREYSRQVRQEEVVLDENGIPIPELDGSIHDIFESNDNDGIAEPLMDMDEDVENHIAPLLRKEVEHIVQIRPAEAGSHHKSEYSYNTPLSVSENSRVIEQIWAGPMHWKLKFIRSRKAQFTGTDGAVATEKPAKQGRKKALPTKILFEELNDFDITLKLKTKRKPPTTDRLKTLLPIPDYAFLKASQTLTELSSKPGVCPVQRKLENDGTSVDVAGYNYDNPNDSLYCSQNVDDNDIGDAPLDCGNGDDEIVESQAVAGQHRNFIGDNLVDAPEVVPKVNILYAMQPKKIDMKKLKAAVWQILTSKRCSEVQKENDCEAIRTTFSEVFKRVPALLPEKMRKDITCPILFLSLLFLCNEHNLELKQRADCKDADILVPVSQLKAK